MFTISAIFSGSHDGEKITQTNIKFNAASLQPSGMCAFSFQCSRTFYRIIQFPFGQWPWMAFTFSCVVDFKLNLKYYMHAVSGFNVNRAQDKEKKNTNEKVCFVFFSRHFERGKNQESQMKLNCKLATIFIIDFSHPCISNSNAFTIDTQFIHLKANLMRHTFTNETMRQ